MVYTNRKLPSKYVPGSGRRRGATGFTTARTSIGPLPRPANLREFLNQRPPPNYVEGLGRGATGFTTRSDIWPARASVVPVGEGDDNDKFDDADVDEEEADAIWEAIDQSMDSRRKDRREARLKQEIQNYTASNPTICEQFGGLKRQLHTLSFEEWDNVPEVRDYSGRNKMMKKMNKW